MNCEGIKQASVGRCVEIIEALTPLTADVAERGSKDHPCPVCGGDSVIWPGDGKGSVDDRGQLACRNCTDDKPTGDIIDTVRVFGGFESQGKSAKAISTYLGLSVSEAIFGKPPEIDIIEAVAKAKRMPLEAFRQFEPIATKRGRDKTPVARVPVYNESGEVHSHFDLTPKDKGFFKKGKGNAGMFFPGRLPIAGETWLLVEGPKDASALVGMGYNAAGLPGSSMPKKYAGLFKGIKVITVADLDVPGQDGAKRTGGVLSGIAASILTARLPGEIVATKGPDVRDVIRSDGQAAVEDAIERATPWTPRECDILGKDERPEELLTLRYAWHVDRVTGHLGKLGWTTVWIPEEKRESRKLYQRGGQLVGVVTESKPDATAKGGKIKIAVGTPRIQPLPSSQLALRIADSCQLITEAEKTEGEIEKKAVPPPKWLVDGILSLGDYGSSIRHLETIVTAPTIRPDGSVLQKPGWDASGLLFRPSMKFAQIPDKPTQTDATNAAKRLIEVVADFPLTDDADKSAWLALVLSMIGRPCVTGQVPLFAITANIRGAGKSMLVDCASIIAYGHAAARTAYASEDDEMRKRITSLIIEGSPAVLLDNIDRPIGGASLDALLTAERWKDRELGSSRTIDLPARAVWTATGNNLRFRSDIARRVVPIRLDSPLERPEHRTDFQHADLIGWTREHRGELVTAALVILRAYFVEGCPKQSGGQFGSFETWSDIIRGAIVWAGMADPILTIESAEAEDDSAAIVAGLVGGLLEIDDSGLGLTSAEVLKRLTSDIDGTRFQTMRGVILEVATRNGKPDCRLLGAQLKKYRGRTCNGYRIDARTGKARQRIWYVQRVERGVSGVSGESCSSPPYVRDCCVSHDTHTHMSDTQAYAYRDGAEGDTPDTPHTPSLRVVSSDSSQSPSGAISCPKCGGPMSPAQVVGGYQNWDCLSPGCNHVQPLRVTASAPP